jgi:hypothetical protein
MSSNLRQIVTGNLQLARRRGLGVRGWREVSEPFQADEAPRALQAPPPCFVPDPAMALAGIAWPITPRSSK